MKFLLKPPDPPRTPNADEVLATARETCNRSLSFIRLCHRTQSQEQHKKLSLIRVQYGEHGEHHDGVRGRKLPWEDDESESLDSPRGDASPATGGGIQRRPSQSQSQTEFCDRLPPLPRTPRGSDRPMTGTRPDPAKPGEQAASKAGFKSLSLPRAAATDGSCSASVGAAAVVSGPGTSFVEGVPVQGARWRGALALLRQPSSRIKAAAEKPSSEAPRAAAPATASPAPEQQPGAAKQMTRFSHCGQQVGDQALDSQWAVRWHAETTDGADVDAQDDAQSCTDLAPGSEDLVCEDEQLSPLAQSSKTAMPQQPHAAARPSRTAALLAMLEEEVELSVSDQKPRQRSFFRALLSAASGRHLSADGSRLGAGGTSSTGGAAACRSGDTSGGGGTFTFHTGSSNILQANAESSCVSNRPRTFATGCSDQEEADEDDKTNVFPGEWALARLTRTTPTSISFTTGSSSSPPLVPSPLASPSAAAVGLAASSLASCFPGDLPLRTASRSFSVTRAVGGLGALPGTPTHTLHEFRPTGQLGATYPGGVAGGAGADSQLGSPSSPPSGPPTSRQMRKTLSCTGRDAELTASLTASHDVAARLPWRVSKKERQLPKQRLRPCPFEVRTMSLKRHVGPAVEGGGSGSASFASGGAGGSGSGRIVLATEGSSWSVGASSGANAKAASASGGSTSASEAKSTGRSYFGVGAVSSHRRVSSNSVVPLTLQASISLRGARETD